MLEVITLADIAALCENFEVECKLAVGKDGKGALPKDFWETYSAFANSYGGDILLGVREKKNHQFEVAGVEDTVKVLNDLWTSLNNPQKVSANLLTEKLVQVLDIDGRAVVRVHVPRASRKQQPVYLRGNPLTGTYRRLNSSDCLADEETVRRMLAEQVEDVRDSLILSGYGIDELDLDSLHAYRNMLSAHKPDHPWTALDDLHFLRSLGGWRQDRMSGAQGLTLAGLLLFGQWPAIQEAVPYYFVDYQEQPEAGTETRWLDRVAPDGSWSGNLFDFYRRVVRKLVSDLKVPFALKGDVRQDDTPVHRALREALVNALVHADYTGQASVLVIKQRQGFVFRNPGRMRVPVETALQGGESDCRNRTLHQMFLMIGLGERAGSGLPKIRLGWEQAGGRLQLADTFEPYEQTRLEMTWADSASEARPSKVPGKTSGKTSGKILDEMRENAEITIPELSARIGVTGRSIERNIKVLQEAGRLHRVGPAKGGHWEVLDAD